MEVVSDVLKHWSAFHRVKYWNKWHTWPAWLGRRKQYNPCKDTYLMTIYQKTWIFNKIWCSVVFQLLVELFVMNVLEISYNCFLKNYKACIWGFVSSGMLILVMGEWFPTFWSSILASIWTINLTWKSLHLSMNSEHSFKFYITIARGCSIKCQKTGI